MQIIVDIPNHYLDDMHRTPDDFALEAKLAMAVKGIGNYKNTGLG